MRTQMQGLTSQKSKMPESFPERDARVIRLEDLGKAQSSYFKECDRKSGENQNITEQQRGLAEAGSMAHSAAGKTVSIIV